jgi:hypothetical protein
MSRFAIHSDFCNLILGEGIYFMSLRSMNAVPAPHSLRPVGVIEGT